MKNKTNAQNHKQYTCKIFGIAASAALTVTLSGCAGSGRPASVSFAKSEAASVSEAAGFSTASSAPPSSEAVSISISESDPDSEDRAPGSTAAPALTLTPTPAPSVDSLSAGTILDASQVSDYASYFKIYEITEGDAVYERINNKSYRANDNISLSDLRYLKILHYNFHHEIQVGEMIVNAAIAEDTIHIFEELYASQYEIEKMYLVDNYWTGDAGSTDENSIEYNNTSAFNYREITGGGKLSNHALGRAIDINPQQNPYVYQDANGNWTWDHDNASAYIDRTSGDPHVIVSGDICQSTFEKYGFSWGGYWHSIKDYQHFEKN